MLYYHKAFSEGFFRFPKVILLVVKDEKIGAFLLRVLKGEKRYHVILVTHEQQAMSVIQEVQPDLFILDYGLAEKNGWLFYNRLHATKGLEDVPAILSTISTRFSSPHVKDAALRDYDEPSEVESFLHTIQEVLT